MRVLVSGAHGMIGSAVVARLAADGHAVVTLDRPGSQRRAVPAATGSVRWDPSAGTLDRTALADAGRIDAVVHLAGAGIGDRRWSAARRQELVDSRVGSTRLLAAELAIAATPPEVLVSASAVGIYGDRGDDELTEDDAAGDGFLADLCRQWEEATGAAAEAGVRVVTLRSGIVLSPIGGALARQLPLFRLGLGGRLGDGRQWVSWITLADEVGVVVRAITDPGLRGPVNAAAPQPVTNAGLTRAIARAVHRPAALAVPRTALALAVGRQLADEMLLASQRVRPDRLSAAGHRFEHPEIDAALAAVLGGR
ncbi:MAG: TIGR01777 family oxidoreductase [Acidimicrobiales bacterium]